MSVTKAPRETVHGGQVGVGTVPCAAFRLLTVTSRLCQPRMEAKKFKRQPFNSSMRRSQQLTHPGDPTHAAHAAHPAHPARPTHSAPLRPAGEAGAQPRVRAINKGLHNSTNKRKHASMPKMRALACRMCAFDRVACWHASLMRMRTQSTTGHALESLTLARSLSGQSN